MDIEEVKKILEYPVTIDCESIDITDTTGHINRWTSHTGQLKQPDIDRIAGQIRQLVEPKLGKELKRRRG